MMNISRDPLLDGLSGLATPAPRGLIDQVAARWVRAPGPVGELAVAFTDQGIAYVRPDIDAFPRSFRERFERPLLPADQPPEGLFEALASGRSTDLNFDLRGLTGFQQEVLLAAREIPRGEVRPYSWIAREIGRPRAVRAVGSALGLNPVPILIPCHRVTRSDGAVGGYVFGPEMKEMLLRAEDVDLGGP